LNEQTAHNLIAFFSFAAAALNIALIIYVLYKNPRERANQVFALMGLGLAIWAFGDAMYNISNTVNAWSFWVRFQAPGEIFFSPLFLHLALVFPAIFFLFKGRRKVPVLLCLYLPALFALVSFYSTTWVFELVSEAGGTDLVTVKGWLYWAYAFYSYTLLIAALALYAYNYYRSRRLREKRIAQVMVVAVAVPLVINILENARLYTLSSTPCFFTISAAVLAYGILRYQMFTEVELVLKRSIVYFTLTVLITSAYVLIIVISERFISSYFSAQGFIITALFILLLVLILEPLRSILMKGVDRLFFRKDYEYGQMLASFAESLTELSSLDEISRRITDTLTDSMGLTGAALFYEPLEQGGWSKQMLTGFIPAYLDDASPRLRLEGGKLFIERPEDQEVSFDVLEIPLVFERERLGTLALGEKLSGYDFSFSDRSLLAAMAPQMAIALKNGALYQEVLEKQRKVNELMERVANAHEEERRRISRELHDGVAQSFLGVVFLSEFTLDGLEEDLARAREDLETLTRRAHEGLEELRSVIDDLRPIPLEVLGLKGAAEKLVNDISAEGMIEAVLKSNLGEAERLPPVVEGNLYRILQESLNNIRKHADAKKVSVELLEHESEITLKVADDGVGLPASTADSVSGMGLSSMQERAAEMGGELSIESERNRGTTVTVRVPLTEGNRDD
jgi:signal transduction histidine kinase